MFHLKNTPSHVETSMSKRSRFPELKAELCQRQAHAREIGKRIRATSGEERMKLWEEKRDYGRTTRAFLLLYAFMRGRPRAACEPKIVSEDYYFLRLVFERAYERLGFKTGATPEARRAESDAITTWLKQKPPQDAPVAADAEALPGSPS